MKFIVENLIRGAYISFLAAIHSLPLYFIFDLSYGKTLGITATFLLLKDLDTNPFESNEGVK